VLETEFETADGTARVVDCMPPRTSHPRVVRVVEGVRGAMTMRTRFNPRFDYGRIRPWVRKVDGAIAAVAGPEALELRSDVPLQGHDFQETAEFTVAAGQRVGFVLTSHSSWEPIALGSPRPQPSTRRQRFNRQRRGGRSGRAGRLIAVVGPRRSNAR
jgi:GH15 family glucan-1,4-alpha-glucosidase